MASETSKNLWGKPFRVVKEGLAETDVVIFVERLLEDQRKTLKKLEHLDSLHDLATQTIEDAEKLAAGLRKEGEMEGQARAARIQMEAEAEARQVVADAEATAEAILSEARQKAAATQVESRRKAMVRLGQLEDALKNVSEEAVNELAGRMPSHYIGKYLRQSVHFLAAFEQLMREARKDIEFDEGELPELFQEDAATAASQQED